MADTSNPADAEFLAMQTIYTALEPLDDDARNRVVNYIVARLEVTLQNVAKPSGSGSTKANGGDEEVSMESEGNIAPKYNSLAELYNATQPESTADKALVAGYWLQICQGVESFDGLSANKELKHLGHGLANITNAIDSLKSQKPALALQLKKSGKSQQARKVYKITVEGIKRVEGMING